MVATHCSPWLLMQRLQNIQWLINWFILIPALAEPFIQTYPASHQVVHDHPMDHAGVQDPTRPSDLVDSRLYESNCSNKRRPGMRSRAETSIPIDRTRNKVGQTPATLVAPAAPENVLCPVCKGVISASGSHHCHHCLYCDKVMHRSTRRC